MLCSMQNLSQLKSMALEKYFKLFENAAKIITSICIVL